MVSGFSCKSIVVKHEQLRPAKEPGPRGPALRYMGFNLKAYSRRIQLEPHNTLQLQFPGRIRLATHLTETCSCYIGADASELSTVEYIERVRFELKINILFDREGLG